MIFEIMSRNGIEVEEYKEEENKQAAAKLQLIRRRRSSAEFWQRLAQSSKPARPKRLNNNRAITPRKKTRPKSANI